MDSEELKNRAKEWVKSKEGKLKIINLFASRDTYLSETRPTTLFMAGSPGAGKTEISRILIKRFNQKPVRIDADEIRAICPGYDGANSSVFQDAANKGVNILYDYCLENSFSAILDGTFAYADHIANIERSLQRGRFVNIWFVYQDPIQAWKITKARENEQGRVVPMDVFIRSYFGSQNNVNEAKVKFGEAIQLNFILKNFEEGEKNLGKLKANIIKVDSYIPKSYTESELRLALETTVL